MRVALINPPYIDRRYNFTYSVDFPLGLAYISSYLKSRGVDVQIIDSVGDGIRERRRYSKKHIMVGQGIEKIISKIDRNADFIGISARFSTQHNVIVDLIRKLKKNSSTPIVVGGVHATSHPKLMRDAGADHVITGEGEKQFYELCTGKIRRDKGFIQNLDSLPFPDRDSFPIESYIKEKTSFGPSNLRFTPITSSRGCPFSCAYCASAVFWKNKLRMRSASNVLAEIKHCKKRYSINEFHFIDDNMSFDLARFREIIDGIKKLDVKWTAANGLRVDNIDNETLVKMKESGCTHITLAPENGSQRILKQVYKKRINLNHLLDVIRFSNSIGLKTCAYLVIGHPDENSSDRKNTFEFIRDMAKLGLDEVGIFPLIPYPECSISKDYPQFDWEDLVTGYVPQSYPNSENVIQFKSRLYKTFLLNQLRYHPNKSLRLVKNLVIGKQDIKTDRVIRSLFKASQF